MERQTIVNNHKNHHKMTAKFLYPQLSILDRCTYVAFATHVDNLMIADKCDQEQAMKRAITLFNLDFLTARKYCHLYILKEFDLLQLN